MRHKLLQNVIAIFLQNPKCNKNLSQNVTGLLLQNATVLLQIATVITKCINFIAKCDSYYKMCCLLKMR